MKLKFRDHAVKSSDYMTQAASSRDANVDSPNSSSLDIDALRQRLSLYILQEMHEDNEISDDAFREVIADVIANDEYSKSLTLSEKRDLAASIFNKMRRLDILQPMMDDPGITEIMVNGANCIFFEKSGRLYQSSLRFKDAEYLESVITSFFSRANRPLNESSPIADLRLPDGSRANAVLPPVAPDGPIFTIRKFTGVRPDMETLIRQGFINREASDYLSSAVISKKTIFICGGTGSGKTTFLNTLSSFIPKHERVVTIEDSAELRLQGIDNLVRLEARLPGPDGHGSIDIGKLIRTALRMRPDRIIVGEVRGEEAAEMLHALHTGHPGSLCTGHANSCTEMLNRLATMVMAGSSLPFDAVIRQIEMGIDILVHIRRNSDGKRVINEICRMGPSSNDRLIALPVFIRKEQNLEKHVAINS
ncbi:MAG: CpaF family protein [Clostridiaceae bacterium]|nr:CpaF family protein [Clostridiaceae bacterium]